MSADGLEMGSSFFKRERKLELGGAAKKETRSRLTGMNRENRHRQGQKDTESRDEDYAKEDYK